MSMLDFTVCKVSIPLRYNGMSYTDICSVMIMNTKHMLTNENWEPIMGVMRCKQGNSFWNDLQRPCFSF